MAGLVASGWLALASQVVDVGGLASVGWQELAFETSTTQGVESAQSGWLDVDFLQSCLEESEQDKRVHAGRKETEVIQPGRRRME